MRLFRTFIDWLTSLFTPRCSFLEKKTIKTIDLSDLFVEDLDKIKLPAADPDDFKVLSTTDDYNREFLSVFQACKKSFFLDYNHRDGHFRV